MAREEPPQETTVSLRLENSQSAEIGFCLEPWAEVFAMPPGATFEITAAGRGDGKLHVTFAEGGITLYVWSGATARVFCDGVELGADSGERPHAPPIPPGTDMPSFMRSLFSGP